jgi:RimJ/RimL family protein N-acetyltransferase
MADCDSGRPAFPEFATLRLGLRKLRAGDEDFLARMDSDPAVMRHIHSGPLSYQEALAYARSQIELAQYRRHWGKWVIAVRESGVCAGWVELSKLSGPCRDDLQVGYELAPEHWGVGYATEAIARVLEYAFRDLELDRLKAIVRPENFRSLRVLKKLGFRKVGQRRDSGGHLCAEYCLNADRWPQSA